jgi:SAM-dependent methyltransferase
MVGDQYGSTHRSGLYNWSKRAQAKEVARWLRPYTAQAGGRWRVLEIGPGAGEMAPYLSALGEYKTQDRHAGADVVQLLPGIGWWKLDMIYASHVLEHLRDSDEALDTLREAHDALVPGGYFVIQVPDLMRWSLDFWDVDCTHGVPFTRRRIRQWAEMSGFRVMRMDLVAGPMIGWAAHLMSTAWKFAFVKGFLAFFPELAARVRQAGYTLNGDILVVLKRRDA